MSREAASAPSVRYVRAVRWWALLPMVWQAACLLDEQRCGEHQVAEEKQSGMGACVCAPDSVPNPRGYDCMPCGANEQPKGGLCVCNDGFLRDVVSGTCVAGSAMPSDAGTSEQLPTGQGTPCNSAADCRNFEATYCPPVAPMACVVEGCADRETRCSADFVCCQIPALMMLARLGSICIPSSRLLAGACPYEGTLVSE